MIAIIEELERELAKLKKCGPLPHGVWFILRRIKIMSSNTKKIEELENKIEAYEAILDAERKKVAAAQAKLEQAGQALQDCENSK